MIRFRQIVLTLIVLFMMGLAPVFAGQPGVGDEAGSDVSVQATATENDDPDSETDDEKRVEEPKDPNRGRFLPIPIFITEPAIGEGLGLAVAYFHPTKDSPVGAALASPASIGGISKEQAAPPTMTGVMAAYTNNDTVAAGIGHMNSFKDDHIRFTGLVALADVNSTFYLLDYPFKFNLEGALVYQETRFRFGDSKWFWGIGFSYLDANTAFLVEQPEDQFSDVEPLLDLFRSDVTNSGLSVKLAWDARDNTSMPNDGLLFDFALWRYDDFIGSDYDYWDARLKLLSFHKFHEKFVLGLRLEGSAIDGNAPFFAIPWVTLRGIPAMRYQGDRVGMFELEGRYTFSPRWAVLGFAGTGYASSKKPAIDTNDDIYNYGLGARYKVFDAQNVWVGIDIARGPEDTNWYIQIGHAW